MPCVQKNGKHSIAVLTEISQRVPLGFRDQVLGPSEDLFQRCENRVSFDMIEVDGLYISGGCSRHLGTLKIEQ